jgi:hypothetical protein
MAPITLQVSGLHALYAARAWSQPGLPPPPQIAAVPASPAQPGGTLFPYLGLDLRLVMPLVSESATGACMGVCAAAQQHSSDQRCRAAGTCTRLGPLAVSQRLCMTQYDMELVMHSGGCPQVDVVVAFWLLHPDSDLISDWAAHGRSGAKATWKVGLKGGWGAGCFMFSSFCPSRPSIFLPVSSFFQA